MQVDRLLAALMVLPVAAYGQTATATAGAAVGGARATASATVTVERYAIYGIAPRSLTAGEMAFAARVLGLAGAALILYELFKPDPDRAAREAAVAAAAKRAAARERLIRDLSEITPDYLYPVGQMVDVTGEALMRFFWLGALVLLAAYDQSNKHQRTVFPLPDNPE